MRIVSYLTLSAVLVLSVIAVACGTGSDSG